MAACLHGALRVAWLGTVGRTGLCRSLAGGSHRRHRLGGTPSRCLVCRGVDQRPGGTFARRCQSRNHRVRWHGFSGVQALWCRSPGLAPDLSWHAIRSEVLGLLQGSCGKQQFPVLGRRRRGDQSGKWGCRRVALRARRSASLFVLLRSGGLWGRIECFERVGFRRFRRRERFRRGLVRKQLGWFCRKQCRRRVVRSEWFRWW